MKTWHRLWFDAKENRDRLTDVESAITEIEAGGRFAFEALALVAYPGNLALAADKLDQAVLALRQAHRTLRALVEEDS